MFKICNYFYNVVPGVDTYHVTGSRGFAAFIKADSAKDAVCLAHHRRMFDVESSVGARLVLSAPSGTHKFYLNQGARVVEVGDRMVVTLEVGETVIASYDTTWWDGTCHRDVSLMTITNDFGEPKYN